MTVATAHRRETARADFPPLAVEGSFPGARRDIADALKRFAVRIGVPPVSAVAGVTVGPIEPATHGSFYIRTLAVVDGTHPHRGEVAAHEFGHAFDAALMRALVDNAKRTLPPRCGLLPAFDSRRIFASTDRIGMRDYENDAVKEQHRRLQSLSRSYVREDQTGRFEVFELVGR